MTTLREHFRNMTIAKLMAIAGPVLEHSQQYEDYLKAMSDAELARDLKEAFAEMDTVGEPYQIKTGSAGDYVQVCGNCFPGDTIKQHFPDLAHLTVGHTICAGHSRRQLREHFAVNAIVKAALEAKPVTQVEPETVGAS